MYYIYMSGKFITYVYYIYIIRYIHSLKIHRIKRQCNILNMPVLIGIGTILKRINQNKICFGGQ